MQMLHCMIKLRPDLESTHQAGHFSICFVQIRQIEADINQLNILGLECVYLSGCSQFEQVGTGQVDSIRNSVTYHIISALDFNKSGCVRQI